MPDTQIQPKIVQVPSIGNIQFPGDMPDDQISAAIQKNYPQLSAPAPVTDPTQQAANRTGFLPNTSMSAGTSSYKAPDDPYAVKPNTFKSLVSNAGIPTSQPATTEAVRGMLHPQADPNETNPVVHALEQWPLIGGDTRARADLSKRADQEGGTGIGIAHRVASWVPLVGPAVTAAQDKYDQGDYTGAVGAGLNALLSMEGMKGAVTPKPTGAAPLTPDTVNNPAAPVPTADVSPSLSQLTREASGPRASIGAKAAGKVLGGGPEAMAKAPIKQQTAAGSATNAEVAQYAADNGINLLPGQATGARGLQTIQAVGERSVVAPGDLPERLEQQKAAFGNLVDDFKTRVSSEAIPDTEAAGANLKSQAQAGLDNLKQSAQQDYSGFQQQTGDIPVDLSDVKAKYAQKLADQAEALKNVPAQYANPIRNVLNKLSGIEAGGEVNPKLQADFDNAVNSYGLNADQQAALRTKLGLPAEGGTAGVKMSTAQQLRSAYLDIARDYTGNVPKPVQRIAGQAAADIDTAMGKAADSVGATDQWRQANSKWKQLQQTYNNPEHPLYKILQEPDAVKVPSKLLGKGNYGGSPNTVRQLQQAGIDLSPLKREVAQQIADKNFALTNGGKGLAGYSTDFLKTLYNPAELDELTKMGRVGRAIRFEMNPSGTSNVMEGRHQLMGIIHGTVGATVGPIASRITTSKAFARATMGDIVPKPRGLMDVLSGRDVTPPEEPPTGNPPNGSAPAAPAQAAPRSFADILSGKPEERTNVDYRAAVDSMTPEQKVQAIFRNKLSDLPNDRAYDLAKSQLSATHPHIGFADIDDFKDLNTKLGEPGVDSVIFPAVGDLVKDAIAKENGAVHAFHVHGDEFNFLGKQPEAISRVVGELNTKLKDATFQVTKPDGTIAESKVTGFSHGTGSDEASAADAEKLDKQARKDAGLRKGDRDKTQDQDPSARGNTSRQYNPVNDSGRQNVSQSGNPAGTNQQKNTVNQPSLADILNNRKSSAPASQPERSSIADILSSKNTPDNYAQAKQIVQEFGTSSSSLLQRRLRISYKEAAALQDRMFADGLTDRTGNGAKWKGGK